jgi:hypothetical protein
MSLPALVHMIRGLELPLCMGNLEQRIAIACGMLLDVYDLFLPFLGLL